MSQHAVIVGGGVIGAACAYYLRRSGWDVTVLDRGRFGAACSHANCGLVSPSHAQPLCVPGAVGKTLKLMMQRNSPFYIKPRLDPTLWRWLWNFARKCNEPAMLAATSARAALLNSSMALYEELLAAESIECEWQKRGCLFLFHTAEGMAGYAKVDKLLDEQFGLPATRYDGDAVADLEPALLPGLGGGWLYEMDAHLRPDRLMSEWRRVLDAQGVDIREACDVAQIRSEAGRALALETSAGEVAADAFVFAAGALTPTFARGLGCPIPIQPGKGYSLTMPRPQRCPEIPLLCPEHKLAVTPMQSGYRLGSTMEFAGYDTTLDRKRLGALKEAAVHYLHEPYCDPVEEEWYGWRPMTYDGIPIIDRSPALANAWLAAGHNMLGLSMSPATGRLLAELMCGEPPHVDSEPYRVGRFA
jgi:D-amino-acid dehydrogenase